MPITPFRKHGLVSPASSSINTDNPLFSVFGGDSGLANLSSQIVINSTTQTASFRVEAKDAGASTWTPVIGATSLTLSGTGSAPSLAQLTPFTASADKGVQFNTAKYYGTGSTSAYDIANATDDIILEVVFQHVVTGAEQCLFSKYDTATGKGFLTVVTASDTIQSYGAIAHAAFGTLINKSWYHLIVFADRNGNNRVYLNGALGNSTANLNNAQTNTQELKVGAYGAAISGKSSSIVSLCQLWTCAAGTINTTAEQDTIAASRFNQLCGTYPLKALGTATPTFTRASIAYLDRVIDETTGERRLFKVGAAWPRVVRRKNGSDGWFNGYLSEGAVTNRFLYSEDFSNAAWTKLNGAAVTGTAAPDGSTNAFAFTPTASTGTHAIQQTVAGSTDYISIFAKKGSNDYMGIRLNSGGTDYAIFNLATGAVANTSGSSINATIVDYGNGWYLCGAGPGGGTNQVYFVTTNSSSSLSYTEASGASVGTYFFGAMSNNSTQRFSQSYIITTTASASRQQDLLTFVSASNYQTQPGAMVAKLLLPSSASLAASQGIFQSYTDASNTMLITATTAGLPNASVTTSAASQVSGSGTTNLRTATLQMLTVSFATNNFKMGVGSAELTDSSCTMPAATTLYVGNTQASAALFGVITSLKIYNSTKL